MGLTGTETFDMYLAINKLLDNEDENLEFKMALLKNRSVIKNVATNIQDGIEVQNKEQLRMAVKYCDKGEDKKPIIVTTENGSGYTGLDYGKHTEYDNLLDRIEGERKTLMEGENDFDFKPIKVKLIPKNINGLLLRDIEPLLEKED